MTIEQCAHRVPHNTSTRSSVMPQSPDSYNDYQNVETSPLTQSSFLITLVTPTNPNHQWYGLMLRVCSRVGFSHVNVRRVESNGHLLTMHVDDVAVVEETCATQIARAVCSKLILKKSSGARAREQSN